MNNTRRGDMNSGMTRTARIGHLGDLRMPATQESSLDWAVLLMPMALAIYAIKALFC